MFVLGNVYCANELHTLENAKQLQLVVDVDLLLLQVNRTCILLAE